MRFLIAGRFDKPDIAFERRGEQTGQALIQKEIFASSVHAARKSLLHLAAKTKGAACRRMNFLSLPTPGKASSTSA